jgi:hypothetical protein
VLSDQRIGVSLYVFIVRSICVGYVILLTAEAHSGFMPSFKYVKAAGANAKLVTNLLILLSVLAFRGYFRTVSGNQIIRCCYKLISGSRYKLSWRQKFVMLQDLNCGQMRKSGLNVSAGFYISFNIQSVIIINTSSEIFAE